MPDILPSRASLGQRRLPVILPCRSLRRQLERQGVDTGASGTDTLIRVRVVNKYQTRAAESEQRPTPLHSRTMQGQSVRHGRQRPTPPTSLPHPQAAQHGLAKLCCAQGGAVAVRRSHRPFIHLHQPQHGLR